MCVSGAALQPGALGPPVPTIGQQLSGNPGGFSFAQQFAFTQALSGVFNAAATFKTASVEKQALLDNAAINRANAELVELQKLDERTVSKKERDALRRKITKLQQSINPATAANNILIGGGSPLDTLISTDVLKTADLGQAKVNEAKRIFALDIKKFGYESQAGLQESAAARISPAGSAFTSLLSSATSSAAQYLAFKNSNIRGSASSIRTALGL